MATEQNNTAPSVSDVEIVDAPHSESSEQESSAEETTAQPFSSQSSSLCGEAPSSPVRLEEDRQFASSPKTTRPKRTSIMPCLWTGST
ncbi:Protein of unknown function [Pyronema omphalodes CBS 100304]|uniref:Uncharacterized protein n=1 Tax=Pyronema omphalodes (strain CBS 100304) TaxID=1076935 RepID=U4LYH4_PYROM|nr:Protein of unknown function [Pyronema omphalodes CBS 100304]